MLKASFPRAVCNHRPYVLPAPSGKLLIPFLCCAGASGCFLHGDGYVATVSDEVGGHRVRCGFKSEPGTSFVWCEMF